MSKKPDSLKQLVINAWHDIKDPSDRLDVVRQLQSLIDAKAMENDLSLQSLESEQVDKVHTNHWISQGDILSDHLKTPSDVDLVFTSPPYNADIDYDVYDDDKTLEKYLDFLTTAFKQIDLAVRPGGRVVINIRDIAVGTGERYPIIVHFYNHLCGILGYKYRGLHIWYKGREESSFAWGSYRSSKNPAIIDLYEWIFVFQKDGEHQHSEDDIDKTEFIESVIGVWKIRPVKKIFAGKVNKLGHPCPFPVELARRVIKLYSCVGDTVFDPFAGVGNTAIAAAQSGRNSISLDISQTYVDIAKAQFRKIVSSDIFGASQLNE